MRQRQRFFFFFAAINTGFNVRVHTVVAVATVPQVNRFGTHSVWQRQWQGKTFMSVHYFAVAAAAQ